ncbi:MAG: hypothetical protein R3C24_18215 [Cyanobacteriota/Melainabacteria group bacterium]|nr:hypothetical protein [Candidatus Obscuribacterales bacterium]
MALNIRTVVIAVVVILLLLIFLKSLVKMAFWFLIVGGIGYVVWKAFFKKAPDEQPKIGGSKRYDDF